MKNKFKGMLKNKMFVIGMILFGSMLLVAIFAPLIAPHTYDEQNMAMKLSAPSSEYPLGTDQYGRCIFSRVVYGSRIAPQRRHRCRHYRNGHRSDAGDALPDITEKDRQGYNFYHRLSLGHTAYNTGHGDSADAGFQRHERGHSGGRSQLGAVYQDSQS